VLLQYYVVWDSFVVIFVEEKSIKITFCKKKNVLSVDNKIMEIFVKIIVLIIEVV